MSIWKDGLLLAAGGVAGLALAAWLESEDNSKLDGGDEQLQGAAKADDLELLVGKVRHEAEWAMAECTTDEDREKVYDEVSNSIREFQSTLQKRGEEIIVELRERALSDNAAEESEEDEPEDDGSDAIRFKSSMEELIKALNETLDEVKQKSIPSGRFRDGLN